MLRSDYDFRSDICFSLTPTHASAVKIAEMLILTSWKFKTSQKRERSSLMTKVTEIILSHTLKKKSINECVFFSLSIYFSPKTTATRYLSQLKRELQTPNWALFSRSHKESLTYFLYFNVPRNAIIYSSLATSSSISNFYMHKKYHYRHTDWLQQRDDDDKSADFACWQ